MIPADDPSDKSPYIVSFFTDMMPDEIPENDLDTTMAQAPSGTDVIAQLVEPANPEGTDIS